MGDAIANRNGVDTSQQWSFADEVDLSSTDVTFTTPKNLYIGVSGNVKVDTWGTDKTGSDGSTGVTFAAVPVGFLPVLVKKVYKVGTSATSILSGY